MRLSLHPVIVRPVGRNPAEDLAFSIGVTDELVEVDMIEWDYPQAACLLVRREQT
jgi:hypothetical protein